MNRHYVTSMLEFLTCFYSRFLQHNKKIALFLDANENDYMTFRAIISSLDTQLIRFEWFEVKTDNKS